MNANAPADERPTTPVPPPLTRRPKLTFGSATTQPSMRAQRPHALKPIDSTTLGGLVVESVAPNASDPRRET